MPHFSLKKESVNVSLRPRCQKIQTVNVVKSMTQRHWTTRQIHEKIFLDEYCNQARHLQHRVFLK